MGVFFFQAEDGIRDLVRSRGLGDVYKRQTQEFEDGIETDLTWLGLVWDERYNQSKRFDRYEAVSYTHLTLPTIYSV